MDMINHLLRNINAHREGIPRVAVIGDEDMAKELEAKQNIFIETQQGVQYTTVLDKRRAKRAKRRATLDEQTRERKRAYDRHWYQINKARKLAKQSTQYKSRYASDTQYRARILVNKKRSYEKRKTELGEAVMRDSWRTNYVKRKESMTPEEYKIYQKEVYAKRKQREIEKYGYEAWQAKRQAAQKRSRNKQKGEI